MQGSLQPTHSLANRKMKPIHCVSNRAYCNQTVERQIHYTNSEQFGTVLNYKIIAIDFVKWEKFVSPFRWRIHQPIGKYSTLLPKTFVCEQIVNTNTSTWNVKMRRIWCRSVCTGRFQQNPLNIFRYPNIQLVVSLIFPRIWIFRRTKWQITQISVSCKFFAFSSTYLRSSILQKVLYIIDIPENFRTFHV
jgi:hypothetical protein